VGGQGRGEGGTVPTLEAGGSSGGCLRPLCSMKVDRGAEGPRRRYLAGGGRGRAAKRHSHEVAASSLTSESRSWSRGSSIEGDGFGE
jgi:hypothetical protein